MIVVTHNYILTKPKGHANNNMYDRGERKKMVKNLSHPSQDSFSSRSKFSPVEI